MDSDDDDYDDSDDDNSEHEIEDKIAGVEDLPNAGFDKDCRSGWGPSGQNGQSGWNGWGSTTK